MAESPAPVAGLFVGGPAQVRPIGHHVPMAQQGPVPPEPPAGTPDPAWERRIACAEINRRRVNEAIEQGRRDDEPQVFMCECGRVGCNTTVSLRVDDYEHVRTSFERFLVVPGHEVDVVDEVVERHGDHHVVAERGAGRALAREADDRGDGHADG
jgi:hypothetical protein